MNSKYCTNCGHKLIKASRYCSKCGNEINSTKDIISNSSLNKTLRLTGNISIALGLFSMAMGMIKGFEYSKIFTDLIGAILYNFPRIFFGYELKLKGSKNIKYAYNISIGMLIYSIGIVVLNYIIDGTGWLYIVLIFTYYKSYKETKKYIARRN